MSLPLRFAVVFGFAVVQTALYWTLNHYPPRASSTLPLTVLDRALPFLPSSVWAYFALLACQAALPLMIRTRAAFLRLSVAYGLAMTVAFATYTLVPTHYPRPAAPLEDTLSAWAWRLLARLDTPECCLPSGHILVPVLAAWTLVRERRRTWPLVLVLLLAPAVITTRQHYAWDIAASFVLAAGAWLASGWILERRAHR